MTVPLYETVKRHITDAIAAGRYGPGAKLPSESELVNALSVSRMTVNRALRELTRDGVIIRVQGVGSFVNQARPNPNLAEVRDIRDIIAARGGRHACRVLAADTALLDADQADLFEDAIGVPVFHLLLLHFEDDRPLQLERRLVRRDFAPDLLSHDFTQASLFEILHAIAPISELEHVVEAALPDDEEIGNLAMPAGQPVLRIRRRTWVGHRVVTLGWLSHPGDRYRVAVRLRPEDIRAGQRA